MIRISLLAALMFCAATMAEAADDLYRAQTVVTGQGEANRAIGFAACLADVLIKVSGAVNWPMIPGWLPVARRFRQGASLSRPDVRHAIRDEQGTRDRPYDLIVDFDERKIDDLLDVLGLTPWLSHRPVLALFVEMALGARNYIVTADAGLSAVAPRQSLLAASARRGVPIVLPDDAALAKSGLDGGGLAKTPPSALAARAAGLGGEVALVGRLRWDDSDLAWISEWQMEWQGRPHRWQVRGGTFDDAFRRALGDAAQIMSGNGDPG